MKEKNKKLDSSIANILIRRISPFPKGSTVILSTGELAAVMGHADSMGFSPVVRPFLKKLRHGGKERIVRLENRESFTINAGSKVKIVINKHLYHATNGESE